MLTLSQVAELGKVSGQRVRRLAKQGRFAGAVFTATPIGGYWLVPESAALSWVADEKRERFRAKGKAAE